MSLATFTNKHSSVEIIHFKRLFSIRSAIFVINRSDEIKVIHNPPIQQSPPHQQQPTPHQQQQQPAHQQQPHQQQLPPHQQPPPSVATNNSHTHPFKIKPEEAPPKIPQAAAHNNPGKDKETSTAKLVQVKSHPSTLPRPNDVNKKPPSPSTKDGVSQTIHKSDRATMTEGVNSAKPPTAAQNKTTEQKFSSSIYHKVSIFFIEILSNIRSATVSYEIQFQIRKTCLAAAVQFING